MEAARTVTRLRIGLAGAGLMLGASLVASPAAAPGPDVWRLGVGLLADAHPVRVMIGAALSPLGAAFAVFGCLGVFDALKPGGRAAAAVAAGGFAQWFIAYAAYAAGRPLLAALAAAPELGAESAAVVEATTYLNVHRALGGIGLFFGSMFFFFAVLFRSTGLPRGAAALAPVIYVPLIRLTPLLPAGAGAFWFAYLDLVAVGFFFGLGLTVRRAPRSVLDAAVKDRVADCS
jgi:hypothetical protein